MHNSVEVRVRRLETAGAEIRGSVETVWKIQQALEHAGIEFIPAVGGRGPGVRLRKAATQEPRLKGDLIALKRDKAVLDANV
jgi:hypothetical protein